MAIPRRYSHFLFGLFQSDLTTAIASAIASAPLIHNENLGLGDNDTVCSVSYSHSSAKAVEALTK
jgi:hypothetical protein